MSRIVIGTHDYLTGLEPDSLTVTADFSLDGIPAGENLAKKFKEKSQGVLEYVLEKPVVDLPKGKVTVSVRDRQGNVSSIERTIKVVGSK
ncbi:hypothetical protein [Zavarzinella formosa]|uniref:hypothetical protein n=1 Tax=Zavarzinella formosa TaxID=360055 RepID=UPI0012FA064B|nr:hypothetical protein [Zavarzinella formosa]